MLSSPAKRRKMSPTASAPIEDESNAQTEATEATASTVNEVTNLSPTKRASFQSPTKASLARFNPSLLPQRLQKDRPRNDENSNAPQGARRDSPPEETRRESLVQQVLGNKRRSSAMLDQNASRSEPHTPLLSNEGSAQDLALPPNSVAAPESLSTAITRAFAEARPIPLRRSPLRSRQASAEPVTNPANAEKSIQETTLPTRRAESEIPNLRPHVPQPAVADDFFDTGPSSDDIGEPELPPTPTQLGISPKPEKPRGLELSSSPSGRRARRAAKEAREPYSFRSSPLKPQDQQNGILSRHDSNDVLESGAIEATEIIAQERQEMEDDTELTEKLESKKSLTAQLQRLQAELKQIEAMVDTTEQGEEEMDLDEAMLALLTTDNPSCLPPFAATSAKLNSSPEPPDLIAPGSSALQYLNLFAPGNLKLTTTSSTTFNSTDTKDVLQNHRVILTPPSPFPPNVFSICLTVQTNITQECIVKVSLEPSSKLKSHDKLHSWITSRLADTDDGRPGVHSRDVGTLVWGAGMWWSAILERATIWSSLKDTSTHSTMKPFTLDQEITPDVMKHILPYLTKQSMTFTNAYGSESNPLTPTAKALHLNYTLTPDWTGEIESQAEICGSNLGFVSVPRKEGGGSVELNAEKGLKDVFETMRKKLGVVEAVAGVRKLVFDPDA